MESELHSILNLICELAIAKIRHMHTCHLLDLDFKNVFTKKSTGFKILGNDAKHNLICEYKIAMKVWIVVKKQKEKAT